MPHELTFELNLVSCTHSHGPSCKGGLNSVFKLEYPNWVSKPLTMFFLGGGGGGG